MSTGDSLATIQNCSAKHALAAIQLDQTWVLKRRSSAVTSSMMDSWRPSTSSAMMLTRGAQGCTQHHRRTLHDEARRGCAWPHLGCTVVCLAWVPSDTNHRGDIHNASLAFLAHHLCSCLQHMKLSACMSQSLDICSCTAQKRHKHDQNNMPKISNLARYWYVILCFKVHQDVSMS